MTYTTINFQSHFVSEGDIAIIQLGKDHLWFEDFASTGGLIDLPIKCIYDTNVLGGTVRDDDDFPAYVAVGDAAQGCPPRIAGTLISVVKPTKE